jgi:hypothetical protein
MRIEVPFYENCGDGFQCMQVGMQGVLKHFMGKEYTREELDFLTGRESVPGRFTWTAQVVPALYELGLDVRYFSKLAQEPFLEGESYIRKEYGSDAQHIIDTTDLDVLAHAVKKLLALGLFEQKLLSRAELEKHLVENRPLLLVVDAAKLYGESRPYLGHFITLTGFDADHFFYHEPGPRFVEAHKSVQKEKLLAAWNAHGTDNDVVVVYGGRA